MKTKFQSICCQFLQKMVYITNDSILNTSEGKCAEAGEQDKEARIVTTDRGAVGSIGRRCRGRRKASASVYFLPRYETSKEVLDIATRVLNASSSGNSPSKGDLRFLRFTADDGDKQLSPEELACRIIIREGRKIRQNTVAAALRNLQGLVRT